MSDGCGQAHYSAVVGLEEHIVVSVGSEVADHVAPRSGLLQDLCEELVVSLVPLSVLDHQSLTVSPAPKELPPDLQTGDPNRPDGLKLQDFLLMQNHSRLLHHWGICSGLETENY